MLTAHQQDIIRDLCRRNRLGTLQFQDNGLIHFTKTEPIREQVMRTFPEFELIDAGHSPMMDDRVDDMRFVYWVTLRPNLGD